jgi:hypothetical protein
MPDRRVFRDIDGERGLAHRGSARNNNEFAALQSRRHVIHGAEASRDARDVAFRMTEYVESVDGAGQDFLERLEARPARTAVGNLEDTLLCEIYEFGNRPALGRVSAGGNIAADLNELPQHGMVAHDARIGADIGRAWSFLDEAGEIINAAGRFKTLLTLELLADGNSIRWPVLPD